MKWVVFFLAVLVGVPLVGRLLRDAPRRRAWLLTLVGLDIFNPFHINLISQEAYRGDSRGVEVTSVDLMMMALWVAQLGRRKGPPTPRYFVLGRLLYLGAMLVSLTASPDAERSFYSLWKLLRMYFAFSVLQTALAEEALVQGLLAGFGFGVLWQGAIALWQKYAWHMVRVEGSQSHPNSLAMIVNLFSPIAFALLLSGRQRRWVWLVIAVTGMCDVFTLCRGGMMMFLLETTIVLWMSFRREVTPRKLRVVLSLLSSAIVVMAKSADTIIKRFTEAPKQSEEARRLFNEAARQMASTHPFGIGVNMYSFVLDHGGYADRLGIDAGDRNGIAHHIYWLTAAEMGYVGLGCYLVLLGSVGLAAFRLAQRRGLDGELGVGIFAGLAVTYMQGTAEWIARQTTMAYAFWALAALLAARLGSVRASGPRRT